MADYTGDFELITLDLATATGTYNIRFAIQEINIYEDIWNNQITCDILMNDAKNQILHLPIFGFETLLLQFRTADKGIWSKKFRLVRITERRLIRDREMGYILHFVTPEAHHNFKLPKVSKSYKSKLISDIVSDIHTGWLAGGPIDIETTKYLHHIIIPNLHPCNAINWLATRANSAKYKGANYLYYQDKDLFRFVSMESRLALGPSQTYLFQVGNVRKDAPPGGHHDQDLPPNMVSAPVYNFDHFSDILENLSAGMYGNELLTHSQTRKLWQRYIFDYPSSYPDYQHLYPEPNKLYPMVPWPLTDTKVTPIYKPELPTDTYLCPSRYPKLKLHGTGYDKDNFPFLPEKWIPIRISQLQQLQNLKITMTIPGDSDRTVGQVVEFNLPSPEPPLNDQQVDDFFYRGKYLIQSIRHVIDMDKYITVMTMVKDSVFQPYPLTG